MKILELFAGTASITNAAKSLGWQTFSSDYDASFNTDYTVDILEFDVTKLPWKPDVIWTSPPCESFSVASIGHHWGPGRVPKSEGSRHGLAMLGKTLAIIEELQPRYYFIENPRGMMRKQTVMRQHPIRWTVTYCQYGDTRMKPTDIWTNCEAFQPLATCSPGMTCHEAAPRGSMTGTQGIGTYKDRSRVPDQLCREVLLACMGTPVLHDDMQLSLLAAPPHS